MQTVIEIPQVTNFKLVQILTDFAGVQLLPGELMQQQEDEDREAKETEESDAFKLNSY